MKTLMILAMLVMGSMTAVAQVSKEEQELIDLSNQKWAWKDMEKAVRAGKVRALGISNFDANDSVFNLIMEKADIKPVVLQIEWHLQEGLSVIPGSRNPQHIMENARIFDFALSDADMQAIRSLNKEQRFFNMDYKQAEQFMLNWRIEE